MNTGTRAFRAALMLAVSTSVLLALSPEEVAAQSSDLGSVTVSGAPKPAPRRKAAPQKRRPAAASSQSRPASRTAAPAVATGLPISSNAAIGSNAPAGSAPALAVGQAPLTATQPTSVVSDKILRDVVKPTGDYNETAKFTPGFVTNNTNGTGDSKSGWRGYQDGQFNVTFDGIPFGDANDPSHHSAAYFPGAFLSRVTIDRGPGDASQIGYAPFGGTLGLWSLALSDRFGGSVEGSYGNFNTYTLNVTGQSGKVLGGDTRAVVSVQKIHTNGVISYGTNDQTQGLLKIEKKFGDLTVTAFATGGTENYNNVNAITYSQWQTYGKNYGQVNGNPNTQQYVGYNNSHKATDLEYLKAQGDIGLFHFDNTLYTYSYYYPQYQTNGADQSIEGIASIANGGTLVKTPYPGKGMPGSTSYTYPVPNGDVTGYNKYNNYRAFGDALRLSHDFTEPYFAGQLRAGLWYEHISNDRYQQYWDYTTNTSYQTIGAAAGIPANASYKLFLTSKLTTAEPYIEYEWHPTDRLSITPGYKYVSITRDHEATVNQTTLLPVNFSKTYTANLPYLTARYQVNNEISVYAQASKGYLIPTVSAFYVLDPSTSTISPQTTTNFQVGGVFKSNQFTLSGALYRIEANNFPITNTVNGLTYYQNGGSARYQGAEIEGTYAIGHGLAFYASGALIQAKFIKGANTGLRIGDAPSYTAAGGLVYDDGMFFGSFLTKFVGDAYGSGGQQLASATLNPSLNHIGGWNSTDLVMGIRTDVLKKMGFGESAEVKFGVNNMFDNRNITAIGGTPSGLTAAAATSLTYSFMPSRTIFAGAKINF